MRILIGLMFLGFLLGGPMALRLGILAVRTGDVASAALRLAAIPYTATAAGRARACG